MLLHQPGHELAALGFEGPEDAQQVGRGFEYAGLAVMVAARGMVRVPLGHEGLKRLVVVSFLLAEVGHLGEGGLCQFTDLRSG